MVHKRKKKKKQKKKKHQPVDPFDVLDGSVSVTLHELVLLIHRVNPTKERLSRKETSERYRLKAGLQSLLIKRFSEDLLVERADPENPQLISLKPRFFDEDACHALLPELDPEARSLAQGQIDEASLSPYAEANESLPGTEPAERSTGASTSIHNEAPDRAAWGLETHSLEELLRLGAHALAAYDYDACEDYYGRAFELSGGGLEAARPLLEFFVDHLAASEKAMKLAGSLSMSARKDKQINILLALAAARYGAIDQALAHLDRIRSPRASEVYLLAAKHYISGKNVESAQKCVPILQSFKMAELDPEIAALEKEIHQLKTRDFEPMEREMLLAWRGGKREEAAGLADKLLAEWPENKKARRIRGVFAKQRRDDKINGLLQRADEANARSEFEAAADLLKKAMALSPKKEAIAERLERARNAAIRARKEAEIAETMERWGRGERREALLNFARLSDEQRRRVMGKSREARRGRGAGRADAGGDHFSWLERLLSDQPTIKAEKLIAAVMVLGQADEALQNGAEPGAVLSMLQPHDKALGAIPEAGEVIARAEKMLEAREVEKAKASLRKAGDYLTEGDLESTRASIDAIRPDVLNNEEHKVLEMMRAHLEGLERIERLKKETRSAETRGDYFTARDVARRLLEIDAPGAAPSWLERIAEYTHLIKKEWALTTHDLKDSPACHGSQGQRLSDEDNNIRLTPDGRYLLFAFSHGRVVFLKIFSMDDNTFKRVIIFRTPGKMTRPAVALKGNEVWIAGEEGAVVALSLDPPDILSWLDFSGDIESGCIVEQVWLLPTNGFLWIKSRSPEMDDEEIILVVNLDKRRVERRFKCDGMPFIVNFGGDIHTVINKFASRFVQVYSAQGKLIRDFVLDEKNVVDSGSAHPNGSDYVLLPFERDRGFDDPFIEAHADEKEEDVRLVVTIMPDDDNSYTPLKIDKSNGGLVHGVAVSFTDDLLFVHFSDPDQRGGHQLIAFRPTDHGFEQLYRVESPAIGFATDELLRKTAAIYYQGYEIRAVLLDESKPGFDRRSLASRPRPAVPSFGVSVYMCGSPTGAMLERSLEFMGAEQDWIFEPGASEPVSTGPNKPNIADPEDFAAYTHAMKRSMHSELADVLNERFRQNFPDHYISRLHQATGAVNQCEWSKTVSLLSDVPRKDIDPGIARHVCHMLGMGLFAEGEISEALAIWEEGDSCYDGDCDLSLLIEYARIATMAPRKRKERRSWGGVYETLVVFEEVDDYLTAGKWTEAISIMENYNIFAKEEMQLLARLCEAYLRLDIVPADPRWHRKAMALALFCEKHLFYPLGYGYVPPPYIETWPDERLKDVADRSNQWFQNIQGLRKGEQSNDEQGKDERRTSNVHNRRVE